MSLKTQYIIDIFKNHISNIKAGNKEFPHVCSLYCAKSCTCRIFESPEHPNEVNIIIDFIDEKIEV